MNQLELDLHPADPAYRTIPLTQGQFAIVDAADYDWLNQWKWHADWAKTSQSFYARRKLSKAEGGTGRIITMHRQILGFPVGMDVDHKNHDSLDNRRTNLRKATRSQNVFNTFRQSVNKSGYKGVFWSAGKWRATIGLNKKLIYLGRFDDPAVAHQVYLKALKLHAGEFSCL